MANNETEFSAKMKKLTQNRAVVVTAVTLVAVLGIIIAITLAANRAKQPTPGETGTGADTTLGTADRPSVNDETLPTYNGGETLPVDAFPEGEPAKFALPVSGQLQKKHDPSIQVYSNTMGDYRIHLGLDIATSADAPVFAAADGKVADLWEDSLMGYCVAIEHADDTVTVYKNLAKDYAAGIAKGANVKQGQALGCVGDSATLEMADEPHLHFEMTVGGLSVDPLDYFSEEDVATLSKDTAFESAPVELTTGADTRVEGK